MKIFKNKQSLIREITGSKNLSFVPSMGSFHNGHKYLIKKAKNKKNKVLVSIYVNPKQFDSKNDFKQYPRNLKKDLSILRALKVDYVYVPEYKDIFSFSPKHSLFVDKFSKQLCGKFRKSHFLGVLNIINRFLEIIKPNYMYLGQKDFQQLYLIKQHIIKKKINTKIIICKTIREKNSFALSSRNKKLTLKEKELASKIYHLLYKEKLFLKKNNLNKFNHYKISQKILKRGVEKIDYIKLINISNPNKKIGKSNFNIFIAYYISNVRLIDNL